MHSCYPMLFAIVITMTVGCASFQPHHRSKLPAVLQGNNSEIREHLLTEIPIGTSRDDAERIVKSLGLELVPLSEFSPEPSHVIPCRFEGRKGLFGQSTWLIQFDCPDGKVADVLCETIEID